MSGDDHLVGEVNSSPDQADKPEHCVNKSGVLVSQTFAGSESQNNATFFFNVEGVVEADRSFERIIRASTAAP